MTAEVVLLVGMAAAVVFVTVLLIEGALRPGYDPIYHTGSELELGERGWIQRASFLQLGVGMWAFAAGVHGTTCSVAAGLLLAVFGLGSIVAGVFAPDPVRGYPFGAPSGPPAKLTRQHKIHHLAGPIMFLAIFGACLALVGRLQGPWQAYTLVTAVRWARADRRDGARVSTGRRSHGSGTARAHRGVPGLDRVAGHPPRDPFPIASRPRVGPPSFSRDARRRSDARAAHLVGMVEPRRVSARGVELGVRDDGRCPSRLADRSERIVLAHTNWIGWSTLASCSELFTRAATPHRLTASHTLDRKPAPRTISLYRRLPSPPRRGVCSVW